MGEPWICFFGASASSFPPLFDGLFGHVFPIVRGRGVVTVVVKPRQAISGRLIGVHPSSAGINLGEAKEQGLGNRVIDEPPPNAPGDQLVIRCHQVAVLGAGVVHVIDQKGVDEAGRVNTSRPPGGADD